MDRNRRRRRRLSALPAPPPPRQHGARGARTTRRGGALATMLEASILDVAVLHFSQRHILRENFGLSFSLRMRSSKFLFYRSYEQAESRFETAHRNPIVTARGAGSQHETRSHEGGGATPV